MTIITEALSLTGLPQKIAVAALGTAVLTIGVHDVVQVAKVHHLAAENAKLDTSIHDPATGYVVKLATAENNTAVCASAVRLQTVAIKSLGQKDAAAVAAVQTRYDIEHAERVRAETEASAFLAHKPQGDSLGERVADVDAQVLGDLK